MTPKEKLYQWGLTRAQKLAAERGVAVQELISPLYISCCECQDTFNLQHRAGIREAKQRVREDLIAAADSDSGVAVIDDVDMTPQQLSLEAWNNVEEHEIYNKRIRSRF